MNLTDKEKIALQFAYDTYKHANTKLAIKKGDYTNVYKGLEKKGLVVVYLYPSAYSVEITDAGIKLSKQLFENKLLKEDIALDLKNLLKHDGWKEVKVKRPEKGIEYIFRMEKGKGEDWRFVTVFKEEGTDEIRIQYGDHYGDAVDPLNKNVLKRLTSDFIGENKINEYDEWKHTRIQAKNIFRMLKEKHKNNISAMKKDLENILKQNKTKGDQVEIVWQEFNKYFKLGESKMKITKEDLRTWIKEAIQEETEYQEFFKQAAEKFGFKPEELDTLPDDKKKEFFDYVDANWKGEKEEPEANEIFEPVSPAQGNPLRSVKAKKAQRILAKPYIPESKEVQLVRKLVREELRFINFADYGVGFKNAKRRIRVADKKENIA